MHSPCISVDSFLSACEYTAPIHSTGPTLNTSLLRVRWTPTRILRLSHTFGCHIPGVLRSSCKLRMVRQRRTEAHFFPHNRPPDTHPQFSPQHPTFTHTLEVGTACLAYQRLLVNSYCTFDLCRPRGRARPPSAGRSPPRSSSRAGARCPMTAQSMCHSSCGVLSSSSRAG
jgi:hypothetical protein